MDSGHVATVLQLVIMLIIYLSFILQPGFVEIVTKGGIVLIFLLMIPQLRPLVTGEYL
jgi:hypothetical protein